MVQATFAATLFDEWVRRGLTDVVLCPGSRSAPLVLACTAREELTVHVRIDERSAGFFAIGRALATKRPVALVVTSGTAAAELHACVAEAAQAFVPLLVLTADRPPELHGVGAPQTMNQHKLYGQMVRRFEEPGVPTMADALTWRDLARRLWSSAINNLGNSGPVHLNAAFVEPLVGEPTSLPAATAIERERRSRVGASVDLVNLRVLCVAGYGVSEQTINDCVALHWVVIGDATARGSLPYFDPLLRVKSFTDTAKPDVVVRLGGIPASRVLQDRLREWKVRTIGFNGAGFVADPDRLVSELLPGLPNPEIEPLADADYATLWWEASERVERLVAPLDDANALLNELSVARAVVRASSEHDVPLVVGSSMPVRDVEWWTPSRSARTYSNRGVNGIDGVVSTVFGVAAGSRAIGLVGDVTLLHDVSALVDGLGEPSGACVLVVADNRGGGIFSFLPLARTLEHERFERCFATPRLLDLAVLVRAFGHRAVDAATVSQLRSAIEEGLATNGVTVIVAAVPARDENVVVHESWNAKVDSLLGDAK